MDHSFQYITDPNDPSNKDKSIKDIIEQIDRGFVVTSDKDITTYTPLTLSLSKDVLNIYDDETKAEIIVGISEILKPLINYKFDTPVDFVHTSEFKDLYIFSPTTELGTAVFNNPYYPIVIDLIPFVGYTLLSESQLTRYIVETWVKEKEYLFSDLKVKYYNVKGKYLSLIPIPPLNQFSKEAMMRMGEYTATLIKEGYFTYTFELNDLEDMEMTRSLCNLFEIKIIDSKDLSTWILKTDIDFLVSPEEWLRNNLQLVKFGSFPKFTISLNFSYFNDYIRLYGTVFRDTILKYISYLSFGKLSDDYPFIRPYIFNISVNNDFSISVNLPSYQLILQFKEYVLESLNEGISFLNKNQKNGPWNIVSCDSFEDGIVKRWMIQKIDDDAYPMVFKDATNTEVLIHRSPLAIPYPSLFDLQTNKEELQNEFQKFYKKCHGDIEPVLLEKIDEMSFEQLLKLIPVEERGITYCFSNDTIDQLKKKENPLTRRPLKDKVLKTGKYLEEGLRGVFQVGPLYGLYDSFPTKVNIPNDKGLIRTIRVPTDSKKRELVGNLFNNEVLFEDGTVSPLFEISLPTVGLEKIDEMKDIVNRLWEEGYFLNDWVTAIVMFLKDKSFPVVVTNPILLNAGDSIFDGNVALEYLRENI